MKEFHTRPVFKSVVEVFSKTAPDMYIAELEKPTADLFVMGQITNSDAMSFWSIFEETWAVLNKLQHQHAQMHLNGEIHNATDCFIFNNRQSEINSVCDVFRWLFREYIHLNFPTLRPSENILIKKDYQICLPKDKVDTDFGFEPLFPENSISARFVEFLSGICSGNTIIDFPVSLAERNYVKFRKISTLENPVLRQIRMLGEMLIVGKSSNLPNFANPADMEQYMKTIDPEVVQLVKYRTTRIQQQLDLLDAIFLYGVYETIPETTKYQYFGVCGGWEIVVPV